MENQPGVPGRFLFLSRNLRKPAFDSSSDFSSLACFSAFSEKKSGKTKDSSLGWNTQISLEISIESGACSGPYQCYISQLHVVFFGDVAVGLILLGLAHGNPSTHIHHRQLVDLLQIVTHIVLGHFHGHRKSDHIGWLFLRGSD